MFSTGVPLESVSDQLGHASTGITKSLYVHLLPGSGVRAAKALEDLLYADHVQIESSEDDSVARRSARHYLATISESTFTRNLVGRPGLDPGTLGVFRECPGTFLRVQICWPDTAACPPTFSEVLSHLNSWLDDWLDQGSFQGLFTIQFRGADGEVLDMRRG